MISFFSTYSRLKALAVLVTGCFFLFACNEKKQSVAIAEKDSGKEKATNVVVHYSIGSQRKAYLKSPLMYRVQDTVSYIEFPNTLHVDFYGAGDSIESKLDARYGKYRDTESKIFLKDSVRVFNTVGDTLYCNELYWDKSRVGTEFYTDKPVRIRRRTEIIDGIGMEARQNFKEWRIIKPTGFLKVPASEFPN